MRGVIRGWWRGFVRPLLENGWTYVAAWLLTRAGMAYVFRTAAEYITGDVEYYFKRVSQLGEVGIGATLPEYPTPVVWMMQGLRAASGNDLDYFVWGFAALMLALDAGFTWLLWRQGGRFRALATATWIVFLFLLGPLAYCRFDIAPGVLAGTAALWSRRRPGPAGALVGLGASLKLWPALLVIPLLARRTRWQALIGMGTVGAITASLSLLAGGWDRLVSPLQWQSDRGLQVESIPATWFMYARATEPELRFTVGLSQYNAFEIWGPGVAEALQVAQFLSLAGFLAIAVLAVRAIRNPLPTAVSAAMTMLAIVAVMTVTNKTLSPQYLIWFGGPMAAAIVALGTRPPSPKWRLTQWQVLVVAFITLVSAFLTQIVYPLTYRQLVDTPGGHFWPAMALVGRNAVLVGYTLVVWALAWKLSGEREAPNAAPPRRPVSAQQGETFG